MKNVLQVGGKHGYRGETTYKATAFVQVRKKCFWSGYYSSSHSEDKVIGLGDGLDMATATEVLQNLLRHFVNLDGCLVPNPEIGNISVPVLGTAL